MMQPALLPCTSWFPGDRDKWIRSIKCELLAGNLGRKPPVLYNSSDLTKDISDALKSIYFIVQCNIVEWMTFVLTPAVEWKVKRYLHTDSFYSAWVVACTA